jgi:hypothetical protein
MKLFKRHHAEINAAWAKGLMFGKAVGARDERKRIQAILTEWLNDDEADFASALRKIEKGKNVKKRK